MTWPRGSKGDGAAPRLWRLRSASPLPLQRPLHNIPSFRRRPESRGAQGPYPPLPIRGEDAANAAGKGTAVGASESEGAGRERAPPLYASPGPRHSRESGNLLGRRRVIPAKAGTYRKAPSPRKREPTGRRPPPESAPYPPAIRPLRRRAPDPYPCPYDRPASIRWTCPAPAGEWLHLAPFRPQTAPNWPRNAPFRPRIGLIRRRRLGVNGAKWCQMEPQLQKRRPRRRLQERTQWPSLTK